MGLHHHHPETSLPPMDGVGDGDHKRHDHHSPPPRPLTSTPRNFSHFLRPSLFSKPQLSRDGPIDDPACGGGCSVQGEAAGAMNVTGAPEHRTCGGPELKAGCDVNIRQRDRLGIMGSGRRFLEPSSLMMAPNEVGRNLPQGMGLGCNPGVPVMSLCSQGSLNDPMFSPKRRYEECGSSSQIHSDSHDSGKFDRAAASTKDSGGPAHRSSERNRRGRINKKLRTLQVLLPNCNEVDQVGVLDEAIKYLKTLQQQFLVLSTGSPMCLSPPPMMLPAGIQHMYGPYPGQFPMTGVPRGMSIGAGLRFPIPPVPRTAGLGLQPPALPLSQPPGSLSAWSLSPDCSRPTDSAGHLVDTSDQSDSSSDDEF